MTSEEDLFKYLRTTKNPFIDLYLKYIVWDLEQFKFGRGKIVMDLYLITSNPEFDQLIDDINTVKELYATGEAFTRFWWEIDVKMKAPDKFWQDKVNNIDMNYHAFIQQTLSKLHTKIIELPPKEANLEISKYLEFIKLHRIIDGGLKEYPTIFKDRFIELLNFEIEQIKERQQTQPPTPGMAQLRGLKSILKDNQIESLYQQMQGKYIDTTPDNFKAIFKDEPLPPDFIPVKLLKTFTVALCAYFISELFQKDNPGDYWSKAEHCFEAKNLRQSLNNAYQLNPTQKPRGYKIIDDLLKSLYTPLQ